MRRALAGCCLVLLGCGGAAPGAQAPPAAPVRAPAHAEVDYVAVGPRALLAAIEPLLAHREAHGHIVARLAVEDLLAHRAEGAGDAEAVAAAIAARAGEKLRFVLLAGDAPGPGEEAAGFTPVPTFYLAKMGYENHHPSEHVHPHPGWNEHDHEAPRLGELYASDLPYSKVGDRHGPIAVGRAPVRTPEEASAFAAKVVGYETVKPEGAWRRRIEVFGGPANFGAVADSLIESTATRLLDTEIPYDFDVRVVFPKLDSAYAVPFPDLRRRLAGDLGEGALIAAYVGHGADTAFEDVHFHDRWFEIGTAEDAAALRIGDGKPFFISIACNTGAYDLPYGQRSLGEAMVLNPGGPIAVFAASRESHPYPNALYGQALIEAFIQKQAPTLGEGLSDARRRMREIEMPVATLLFDTDIGDLKEEHEGLYNLLGDPATALRYPAAARLSLAGSAGDAAPGGDLSVNVEVPAIPAGTAILTVETPRSVIRGELVSPRELEAMADDAAWAAMRRNYEVASNKVVARLEQPIAGGRASFKVSAPGAAGEYELKVFAAGGGEAAAGHLRVRVGGKVN
jgi:Peptidase family C25